MTAYYDDLETRDPAERERSLMAALPGQVAHAQRASRAMAERLAGVDAASIDTRVSLARLPVLRKHELLEQQKARRAQDPRGRRDGGRSQGPGAGCGRQDRRR